MFNTNFSGQASTETNLKPEFSPAIADCRFRAPLAPRLARSNFQNFREVPDSSLCGSCVPRYWVFYLLTFIWRRDWDSNPGDGFKPAYTISSRALSTAQPSLLSLISVFRIFHPHPVPSYPCYLLNFPACYWRRDWDSNPGREFIIPLLDFESSAFDRSAISPF
jgi:hypothetical protein